MDLTVKKAVQSDVSGILKVWKELMIHHEDLDPDSFGMCDCAPGIYADFLSRILDDREYYVPVAILEGGIAGYSVAHITHHPPLFKLMPRGEIVDIAVLEQHRRKGIGAVILSGMVEWFHRENIFRIEMNVAEDNSIGRAFWESAGFRPFLRKMYLER